jgi:HTH-type transcriptional regulator, competence development regulator
MRFGQLLQRFRQERGLSLRELGTLAGLDHAYIHRLEAGDKVAPSWETLHALAKSLKISPRKARLLRFMRSRPIEESLVDVILEEPEDFEFFEILAYASFYSKKPKSKAFWRGIQGRMWHILKEIWRD